MSSPGDVGRPTPSSSSSEPLATENLQQPNQGNGTPLSPALSACHRSHTARNRAVHLPVCNAPVVIIVLVLHACEHRRRGELGRQVIRRIADVMAGQRSSRQRQVPTVAPPAPTALAGPPRTRHATRAVARRRSPPVTVRQLLLCGSAHGRPGHARGGMRERNTTIGAWVGVRGRCRATQGRVAIARAGGGAVDNWRRRHGCRPMRRWQRGLSCDGVGKAHERTVVCTAQVDLHGRHLETQAHTCKGEVSRQDAAPHHQVDGEVLHQRQLAGFHNRRISPAESPDSQSTHPHPPTQPYTQTHTPLRNRVSTPSSHALHATTAYAPFHARSRQHHLHIRDLELELVVEVRPSPSRCTRLVHQPGVGATG